MGSAVLHVFDWLRGPPSALASAKSSDGAES